MRDESSEPSKSLPKVDGGWGVVLADPPWTFRNAGSRVNGDPAARYNTMSLDAIRDLPVRSAAGKSSALFLWCPASHLPDGLGVVEAWGFSYRTMIPWVKVRKDGEISGGGLGRPWRSVHEPLIYAVRGNVRAAETQVGVITARRREHSRKPESSYQLIERAFPDGPHLELFARGTPRLGWTAWRHEADVEPASFAKSSSAYRSDSMDAPLPSLPPFGRLDQEERKRVAIVLRRRYQAGDSINALVDTTGYSQQRVRSLLTEAGTTFRKPGRASKK